MFVPSLSRQHDRLYTKWLPKDTVFVAHRRRDDDVHHHDLDQIGTHRVVPLAVTHDREAGVNKLRVEQHREPHGVEELKHKDFLCQRRVVLAERDPFLQENASFVECFPYVCPEPVLERWSFLVRTEWRKRYVF